MSRTTYSEKLKDPRWQRRRLEKLNASDWKCDKCSTPHVTLHVHHIKYTKGREPWEYADDELRVLCAPCHSAEHPDKPKRAANSNRNLASHFTMLSNSVGRDDRLSYCAKGILFMASTHAPHWSFSLKMIRKGSRREGKVAIGNAMRELKRFGYLRITPKRVGGRLSGYRWNWNFNPSRDDSAPTSGRGGSL